MWFSVAVCSELSNEASGYVERGEILERLTDFWGFKKDCAPLSVLLSSQVMQRKESWEFVFNLLLK